MNKLIITLLLVIGGVASTQQQSRTVYICSGPQSKCYHVTPDCKGLRNCSTDISEVTLEKAQEMGRRPCGYCCK